MEAHSGWLLARQLLARSGVIVRLSAGAARSVCAPLTVKVVIALRFFAVGRWCMPGLGAESQHCRSLAGQHALAYLHDVA